MPDTHHGGGAANGRGSHMNMKTEGYLSFPLFLAGKKGVPLVQTGGDYIAMLMALGSKLSAIEPVIGGEWYPLHELERAWNEITDEQRNAFLGREAAT